MKQKANKSARIWEGRESHQTNRDYSTCVFFYICTRQVYPFKFFFLKRTVQKEKNKSLTKKPIEQFCPSVFNSAVFLTMSGDRLWSREEVGASETNKITHTGRQTGCVLALEIILIISCRIGANFMQHIRNLWEQLLYRCGIMKNSVLGKKQSTVHNHSPCVYKHARSHMTNTLSSQSKPVSLLICLYI